MSAIHPGAVVHPEAVLADDVIVGPGAVIEEHVEIGPGCRIDAYASIKAYTRMGRNNHIHSYALVGGEPQDLKFHGEESWLEMGDNNTVREFTTIHRGTESGGGMTRIGSDCLLMAYTHVAHDCVLGDKIIMSNNATLAGHVVVGDHVIIGGLSAVHQFVRIGKHSFVGGMSGVSKDLPPYMLVTETRGHMRGPNLVGLRRGGFSSDSINAIRSAFRTIWLSGIPRKEALEMAESEFGHVAEVQDIIQFVRSSSRGVMTASRESGSDA